MLHCSGLAEVRIVGEPWSRSITNSDKQHYVSWQALPGSSRLPTLHASPLPDVRRRVWAVSTEPTAAIASDFVDSIRAVVADLGLGRKSHGPPNA